MAYSYRSPYCDFNNVYSEVHPVYLQLVGHYIVCRLSVCVSVAFCLNPPRLKAKDCGPRPLFKSTRGQNDAHASSSFSASRRDATRRMSATELVCAAPSQQRLRRSGDSVAAPSQQRCAHHERSTGHCHTIIWDHHQHLSASLITSNVSRTD